jgi:hypothetical protein
MPALRTGGVFLIVVGSLAGQLGGQPPTGDTRLADRTAAIHKVLQPELAGLDELYKHLHSHPELSLQERETAARMAKELTTLGF